MGFLAGVVLQHMACSWLLPYSLWCCISWHLAPSCFYSLHPAVPISGASCPIAYGYLGIAFFNIKKVAYKWNGYSKAFF
jgi:hypothetical protein